MDIRGLGSKIKSTFFKYKYAAIILLVGIGLLLIPQKLPLRFQTIAK